MEWWFCLGFPLWMIFAAIVAVGCGIGTMLEKLVNVLAEIRDELWKRST